MNRQFILLVLCTLVLSGCSKGISVFVKIIGLDVENDVLELEFNFKNKSSERDAFITDIEIYESDTLRYVIVSDSNEISNWVFPNIPAGFKIEFPENKTKLEQFNNSSNLRFEFSGGGSKDNGYGMWTFKPSYFDKESRWMFDEEGNKKINIDCFYESWIGKDIIKIYSNLNLEINYKTIELTNRSNEKIDFKLKSNKKVKNAIILTLDKDLKKDDIINIVFDTKSGNTYRERIVIPSGSTLGIIGKYR